MLDPIDVSQLHDVIRILENFIKTKHNRHKTIAALASFGKKHKTTLLVVLAVMAAGILGIRTELARDIADVIVRRYAPSFQDSIGNVHHIWRMIFGCTTAVGCIRPKDLGNAAKSLPPRTFFRHFKSISSKIMWGIAALGLGAGIGVGAGLGGNPRNNLMYKIRKLHPEVLIYDAMVGHLNTLKSNLGNAASDVQTLPENSFPSPKRPSTPPPTPIRSPSPSPKRHPSYDQDADDDDASRQLSQLKNMFAALRASRQGSPKTPTNYSDVFDSPRVPSSPTRSSSVRGSPKTDVFNSLVPPSFNDQASWSLPSSPGSFQSPGSPKYVYSPEFNFSKVLPDNQKFLTYPINNYFLQHGTTPARTIPSAPASSRLSTIREYQPLPIQANERQNSMPFPVLTLPKPNKASGSGTTRRVGTTTGTSKSRGSGTTRGTGTAAQTANGSRASGSGTTRRTGTATGGSGGTTKNQIRQATVSINKIIREGKKNKEYGDVIEKQLKRYIRGLPDGAIKKGAEAYLRDLPFLG